MIRKMTLSIIFVCLCIAIPLAMLGYKKVELGTPFLALMSTTTRDLNNYKVQIPDIPRIPLFENPEGILIVIQFLIKVVNGLTALINVIILVVNYVIQILEFLVLLVRNLIQFKDSLEPIPVTPL